MKKRAVVKTLYPPYAAGLQGIIEAPECDSKRWIVKVIKDDLPLLLSLEEGEFEIIKEDSLE